jgi:hypothetical protein
MLRYSLTKVKSIPLHLRKKLKWSKTLSPFQNSTGRSIAIYFRNRRGDFKIQIPPMIIQMLIENAIKHGISQLKHGGILLLKIKKENTDLHIQVNNTGQLSQQKVQPN